MTSGLLNESSNKGNQFRALFIIVLFFGINITSFGQKKEINLGEFPTKCKEKITIMVTYHKSKAYKDALPSWRWCFYNCPESTKNIYIIGEKIMKTMIKGAATPELKQTYVDTLLMVYDQRIKLFPGKRKFDLIGKKASTLYKYRKKTQYKEAFNLSQQVIDSSGTKVSAKNCDLYLKTMRKMIIKKEKNCNDMVNAYLKVNSIIAANIGKKPKQYERVKSLALDYADKCLKCDLLDSLYTVDFEKNKIDTNWLDNGITLLTNKKCSSSKVLVDMMVTRFDSKPNSKNASVLGKYFYGKGDQEKAELYLSKAIELEKDTLQLVNHYITLGNIYLAKNKFQKAVQLAKKTLKIDLKNAKANLLIGNAYAFGANTCKELTFAGQEVFWVAVDYYNKAARLAGEDNKTKQKAIKNAAKYAQYYPEKQKLFLKSINPGATYKVGSWINCSTTVRAKQ